MSQISDIKIFNKGMNKDVDARALQPGEYVDAQNFMNSNYADSAVDVATNYNGVYDHEVGVGADRILGLFKDNFNDDLYYFIAGIAGVDRISKFTLSTNTVSDIVSSSFLGFTTNTVIKSLIVTQGILIWTDGENEIGMYDTNVTYGTLTADMLTLAQVTPLEAPLLILESDTTYRTNNITGKFFQFKYRFIFKNKMKSLFSPISDVAYSIDDYTDPVLLAGVSSTVNAINIYMSGANSNGLVESIEIAARSGNDGDFFIIKEIDVDSTFLDGGYQVYKFFNDGLYPSISLEESNQISDDIPKTAGTLVFSNNRIITGNNRIGFYDVDVDYDLEVIYADASAGGVKRIDTSVLSPGNTRLGMNNVGEFTTLMNAQFGLPSKGDIVTVSGKSVTGGGVPNDYSYPFGYVIYNVQFGDSWDTVYTAFTTPEWYQSYPDRFMSIEEISTNNAPPSTGNDAFIITSTTGSHEKTFKSGAWYNVGLQYQDKYGRTNGVQTQKESKVYIKTLGERNLTAGSYVDAGAATIKVTINNAMPSWAESVKVVYSRANVYDQSIQIATRGAANQVGSDVNVVLDIGSIAEWNNNNGGNLGYVWEKGDKIRVLTATYSTPSAPEDNLTDWARGLMEAEIVGVEPTGGVTTGGYAIVIPSLDGLDQSETRGFLANGSIIEIFRPSKELETSQSIYTEASFILDSDIIITGDAYLKSRYNFPYSNGSDVYDIIFESYDISDYSDSEHYDKGRPTAIINQEESQRIATLMYSEVIIPNTDINKLNRFYSDKNYEEYDKNFGSIIHLHNEGDHILMMQQDKVSKVYVDKSVMYDGKGNNQILSTQKRVLSEAVQYSGIYGIHDYRSFQAIGNRRYWLDASRGVVLRLAANGIEEISRYGMRGWFSNACKSLLQISNKAVYGIYDINNDAYIISFDNECKVLSFDEKDNKWTTFITLFKPKYSSYINNRTFFIQTDDLFEMNYVGIDKNIKSNSSGAFGSAVATTVQFPSNIEPTILKNYFGIHINGSHPLDVTIDTEALYGGINQQSSLNTLDFTQKEQEWHASFLRDINTPNFVLADKAILEGDTIKGFHANIKLTLPVAVAQQNMRLRFAKIIVSRG